MLSLLTVIMLGAMLSQDALEYSLSGTTQSIVGLEYFWINPTTGYVHIIKPLTQDRANTRSYQVCMMQLSTEHSSLRLFLSVCT